MPIILALSRRLMSSRSSSATEEVLGQPGLHEFNKQTNTTKKQQPEMLSLYITFRFSVWLALSRAMDKQQKNTHQPREETRR
jgi:hypothetical protein